MNQSSKFTTLALRQYSLYNDHGGNVASIDTLFQRGSLGSHMQPA